MSSVTTTLTPGRGYVRVDLDFTTPAGNSTAAKVWRVVNGVLTPVRDGWPAALSHSKATIYDTEMPMDVPLSYQAFNPLNRDGGFESDVLAWDLAHNTFNSSSLNWSSVTRSTDFYVPGTGTASLKAVPADVSAAPQLVGDEFAITAGTSLTVTGSIMSAGRYSQGVGLVIVWFNSSHVLLTTSGSASDLWPVPGEWGSYTLTATAPASTAFARVGFQLGGIPSSANVFYLDEVYASVATSTVTSSGAAFVSGGIGWWTDPLHPATQVPLQIDRRASRCAGSGVVWLATGDRSRPADSSVLEIPDSSYGAGIFATRKALRSSVSVATLSPADADAVVALHAPGAPVLLQLPAPYLETPRYGLHADLSDGRIASDVRIPIRVFQSTYVDVGAPVGPAEGVLGTRYQDLDVFTTFAQANSAGKTWVDALQGKLSTKT